MGDRLKKKKGSRTTRSLFQNGESEEELQEEVREYKKEKDWSNVEKRPVKSTFGEKKKKKKKGSVTLANA